MPLSRLKIIVVDDSPDLVRLLAYALADDGASVSMAASAEEALAIMDERAPDLLVTDLSMPGVDGFELLARIRQRSREAGGSIPVIAYTGYTYTREETLAAGFDAYFTKPFDFAAIVETAVALTSDADRSPHTDAAAG